MNENKKYYIKIDRQLVSVTEEIYREYHKMGRREKYLEERDAAHGTFNYSDNDTDEMSGEESIANTESPSLEDKAYKNILLSKIWECVGKLTEDEQTIIEALYTRDMTQREAAELFGISQPGIKKRHDKIISKLKKFFNV